jgi:[CysO sulfur-carrier protein]-S-L-cysteine hydrolase
VILLSRRTLEGMVSHCLDAHPLEACGLLAGVSEEDARAEVRSFFPADNISMSARLYEVDPGAMLSADRQAERDGQQLIGVYHSHTHTEGRPSSTDVRQAPDPGWHYVLVSLRDAHPSVRSWRILEGKITEEPVVLQW